MFEPADLYLFVPELILGCCILSLFVGDLLVHNPRKKRVYLTTLALAGLVGAAVQVFGGLASPAHPVTSVFVGQIAVDPVASLFKALFIAVTVVAVLTSLLSEELPDRHIGEYYALLLSILFGMFLMAGANDLLMLYLGVELVSIVSYAMAGYRLHDRRSSEAALKYVIYGGAASGVMLFGISLLYGVFGSTELTAIHQSIVAWTSPAMSPGGAAAAVADHPSLFPVTVLVAVVFVFTGIGYKIAVVPFHMWSPDVYEGAPTPFTGFLSVGPKAAGFALLMRFFVGLFVEPGSRGYAAVDGFMEVAIDLPLAPMIGILAAVTMTVGNLAAIPQTNVKRLLAYSSIAHAGYLLMGFVVLSESAMEAVLLYLVIYFLMNLGAFTVCQAVRDRTGGELVHDFRGLGVREPVLAVAMVVFLLSLTGLPPLAGFIGKFYLFAAVIERGGFWYWVLALIGVFNSAVSLYYYMRIAKSMYLSAPLTEEPLRAGRGYLAITAALAVPVLLLGIYWAPLRTSIDGGMQFFRSAPAPLTLSDRAAPQSADPVSGSLP
jgi:NADH-quinone oxidoreductase subunit N